MIDFSEISYLKNGNDKQRKSYKILREINIFNILNNYSPILVGTVPLGIDIDNSDLDIVCQVYEFKEFEKILRSSFGKFKSFKIENKDEQISVCNFVVDDMEIEIYASKVESHRTYGYRHMIIEYKLLSLYGDDFKKEIIKLKKSGLKTEPAFAKVLKLNGNPYEELLLYEYKLKN